MCTWLFIEVPEQIYAERCLEVMLIFEKPTKYFISENEKMKDLVG